MGIECSYSFHDLFKAAHGRNLRDTEYAELLRLSQDERNERVRRWAEMAGWEIDERYGSDGYTYYAFCPSFNNVK